MVAGEQDRSASWNERIAARDNVAALEADVSLVERELRLFGECSIVLTTRDWVVRPCLCQRATCIGNLRIEKNRRSENRRPHRAAAHCADGIVDSGFELKPCSTKVSVRGAPTRSRSPMDREGTGL